MEVSDAKVVLSNIPLTKILNILISVISSIFTITSNFISYCIKLYLLFYTTWWQLTLLYLIGVWLFNKHIHGQLVRNVHHLRRFEWWKYIKDYFPVCLHKDSNVELDPKRNYLFCPFPHGFSTMGLISAFCLTAAGYHELFPNHQPHFLSLKPKFSLPFLQEFLKATGMGSTTEQSVNKKNISFSGSGNVAMVDIGGAEKAYYSEPKQYRLVLKDRTDFVNLALRKGFSLVPVFSFGEGKFLYKRNNSQNPVSRYIKKRIKEMIGIISILPVARSILQYLYGLILGRKPMNIIVGNPIDVEQTVNPTQKQINDLHEKFIKQLIELFEEHKDTYVAYPGETSLVII